MPLIDISIRVSPTTPEWPGDTPFSCGWTWDMATGSSVNVSSITMSPHVGTHADAPLHVRPGTAGADQLPLDAFLGPATVVDISDLQGTIEFETLAKRMDLTQNPSRILLKTTQSIATQRFPDRWPAISPSCALALTQRNLKLLGVDCPSVDDRDSKTLDVHHTLFDNGAYILENLDLQDVLPGRYNLMAFPTKFADLDAAPVRAILIR